MVLFDPIYSVPNVPNQDDDLIYIFAYTHVHHSMLHSHTITLHTCMHMLHHHPHHPHIIPSPSHTITHTIALTWPRSGCLQRSQSRTARDLLASFTMGRLLRTYWLCPPRRSSSGGSTTSWSRLTTLVASITSAGTLRTLCATLSC